MDLSEYLTEVTNSSPKEILVIEDEVDPRFEITAWAILTQKESPILLFQKIKGSEFPFVTNIFGSRKRIAESVGTHLSRFKAIWGRRLKQPVEPQVVETGPVQAIVTTGDQVNLSALPIPYHYQQDGDKYITGGLIVAKHPETGIHNASIHRLQFQGPRHLGTSLHTRGHLWDYLNIAREKGLEYLEIAIVIGAHPGVLLGGLAKNGYDVDAYHLISSVMNVPLKVVRGKSVDIHVPAEAEIILEGVLSTQLTEQEGPFSEYTGYVTSPDRSTNNVIRIDTITHREEALFQSILPGKSKEHLLMFEMLKEAELLEALKKRYPEVKDVCIPYSGSHFHTYVSLSEVRPGRPNQIALCLMGIYNFAKLVVICEDVDITNDEKVLEEIAHHMKAQRDIHILPNVYQHPLDPSSTIYGVNDKVIIDATKPFGWTAELATIPEEVIKKVEGNLLEYKEE